MRVQVLSWIWGIAVMLNVASFFDEFVMYWNFGGGWGQSRMGFYANLHRGAIS